MSPKSLRDRMCVPQLQVPTPIREPNLLYQRRVWIEVLFSNTTPPLLPVPKIWSQVMALQDPQALILAALATLAVMHHPRPMADQSSK